MPTTNSDGINRVLSQLDKCSDETVRTLRNALGLDPKRDGTPRYNSTQSTNNARRTTRPGHQQREAKGRDEHHNSALSAHSQQVLATKIVNNVLKIFSAKAANSTYGRTEVLEHGGDGKSKCSAPRGSSESVDMRALGQCGLLAFRFLNNLSVEDETILDSESLQFERGMLVFAGKLLSSRLHTEGIQMLLLVRSRIGQHLREPDLVQADCGFKGPSDPLKELQEKEWAKLISKLLAFPKVDLNRSHLAEFILSYQVTTLRLAIQRCSMSVAEKLILRLEPSCHFSPASLLTLCLKGSCSLTERVRKDAEAIPQLLQVVTHGLASSPEDVAQGISIRLQSVAMQHWLYITKEDNKNDVLVEVWGAFTRFLSLLTKSTSNCSKENFTQIKGTIKKLRDYVSKYRLVGSIPATIYMHMSQLASDSKDYENALVFTSEWIQQLSSLENPSTPLAVATIRKARLSLVLEKEDSTAAVYNAVEVISSKLNGVTSEFRAILTEIDQFRKVSAADVQDFKTVNKECTKVSTWMGCIDLLRGCARFSIKLIDSHRPVTSDSAASKANHMHRQLVEKYAPPMVGNILKLMRVLLSLNRLSHSIVSNVTEDVMKLIRLLGTGREECKSLPREENLEERVRLCISETHWSLYENSRDPSNENARMLNLEAACEILMEAKLSVQKRGSLSLKLHRLGRAWRRLGDNLKAMDALGECLNVSRALGHLNEISAKTAKDSVENLHEESASIMFFSALKTWIEIKLEGAGNDNAGCLYFDDDQLENSLRGALLEWQLSHLQSKDSQSAAIDIVRRAITLTCLRLYSNHERPLRRKRLLVTYLRRRCEPDSEHEDLLKLSQDLADREVDIELGLDEDLRGFASHFSALLNVCIAIQKPNVSGKRLEQALSLWQKTFPEGTGDRGVLTDTNSIISWMKSLALISDYFAMTGHSMKLLAVYKLQLDVTNMRENHSQEYVQSRIRIAEVLLDLGYLKTAGTFLLHDWGNCQEVDDEVIANRTHLTKARYWCLVGNMDQSAYHIRKVTPEPITNSTPDMVVSRSISKIWPSILSKMKDSDLLYVESFLLLENEGLHNAFLAAKKAVILLQQCWRTLELQLGGISSSKLVFLTANDPINDAMASLNLNDTTQTQPTIPLDIAGPMFWPLVPRIRRAHQLLYMTAHSLGSYQDASVAAEQVSHLATQICSPSVRASALVLNADLACRSRQQGLGWSDYQNAQQHFGSEVESRALVLYQCALGYYHHVQRQWQDELDKYEIGTKMLEHVVAPSYIKSLLGEKSNPTGDEWHNNTIGTDSKTVVKRGRRDRKTAKDKPNNRPRPTNEPEDAEKMSGVRTYIKRLAAECLLSRKDVEEAANLLQSTSVPEGNEEERTQLIISRSELLIQQAMQVLSKDAVLSMIPESIIAYPVVLASSPPASTITCIDSKNEAKSRPKKATLKTTVASCSAENKDNHSPRKIPTPNVAMLQAFEQLSDIASRASNTLSKNAVSRSSSLLALSSVALTLPKLVDAQILTPCTMAYFMELPNNLASMYERSMIFLKHGVEKDLARKRGKCVELDLKQTDPLRFSESYLRILPSSWIVVSISLSEDQNHLFFTRYQGQRDPFILRLPLNRQHEDHGMTLEEETFTFKDAQVALRNIICSSDETIREARSASESLNVKDGKSKWWRKREQLDREMQDLLLNIETMWLGGFRGLFSSRKIEPMLLARFQKSVERILMKHLPSRLKLKNDDDVVKLNTHVYQLLVNVGSQSVNEDVLEAALTDILYFLVDILQFHNEPNAYDEIDFDAITVEIIDALRSYHEATRTENLSQDEGHLILVLDQNLHMFPWESMPCLQGHSVSRVTSLVDIRERILMMRAQQDGSLPIFGMRAGPKCGTTILNPGGDLRKTQSQFEKPLASLEGWTHITGREPSESEFENALVPERSADAASVSPDPRVVLYFGHGSGLQYIRSKRIKALRLRNKQGASDPETAPAPSESADASEPQPKTATCATTLLFGCSSASLKTVGEFDPYGCPKTYLLGGAPAVLGALWDVTDGDVDAFARGTLVRWGLVEGKGFLEDDGQRKKLFRRGKRGRTRKAEEDAESRSRRVEEESGKDNMSLNEAVAKSRGDCYLRYLNGAAMVVYGVPVYLGE